jgi:hypothetical protein
VVALMFAKRIANSFARHLKNEKRWGWDEDEEEGKTRYTK